MSESAEAATRHLIAACAGIALVTLLLYAPLYRFGYIGYDDPLYVDPPQVQAGVTRAGVRWAFELGPDHAANYHPLTFLSHMADFQLFGRRPGAHHAVNVVLHAAAAVVLLIVLARWTGRLWPSVVVAALFAWHPLHVQSVAWIAERKDVLSALFFMLTMLAYGSYVRRPGWGRYLVVVGLAALGLAAKPMLVTLPAVLLLVDRWPLNRQAGWGRLIAEKIPVVAMAIVFGLLTVLAQEDAGAITSSEKLPTATRLATVPVNYVRYLWKTAWPVELSIFYPYRTWPVAAVAAATLLVGAASAWALARWRGRPWAMVGWFWFAGMLLPVVGIVQVGQQSIADRYTYLPHVGLFVTIVWLAAEKLSVPASGVVAGVVLAACAAGTVYQVRFWSDDLALFGRALRVTDDNFLAHGYVGKALAAEAQRPGLPPDEAARLNQAALDHYHKALALKENYFEVHYNLGNLLLRDGRPDVAVTHYERAIALRPGLTDAYFNLAAALAYAGRYAEAESRYQAALERDPSRESARRALEIVRQRLAAGASTRPGGE